jgi:23S rRNA (cytosine1962-C5)-methyltransferase
VSKNNSNSYQNRVRIIGGEYRRRVLEFPDQPGLRPTPDRVRETVFNWLGQDLTGQSVLDLFAGSGAMGFEAASRHAARVVMIEKARPVARQLQANARLLGCGRIHVVEADALHWLAQVRESFDVIVMDPPKFVENKSQLMGACRGYKDINMLAIQLLNPGGVLLTFSCSGLMTSDLFQKVVADAALDAGREAQIIERMGQAADHPISVAYPEGFYLKGLVVRVL